jgi:hypothetical protein
MNCILCDKEIADDQEKTAFLSGHVDFDWFTPKSFAHTACVEAKIKEIGLDETRDFICDLVEGLKGADE